MSKWVIPLVCLALLTTGGCSGKKNAKSPGKSSGNQQSTRKIAFERYDAGRVPASVEAAVEKNRTREAALVIEGDGGFWIVLTRGLKPTGGYSARVTGVYLDTVDGGAGKLRVNYQYTDPRPDQFVTQVLTYPTEVVLLKGLDQKPAETVFVLQQEN